MLHLPMNLYASRNTVPSTALNYSNSSMIHSSFRLDKYYFLLRRFMSYSFRMLKENDWDLETIDEFANVMINGPLK